MLDDETAASVGPPPVSVAVVDDDPTARRLMRFWLERAGYSVVGTTDGVVTTSARRAGRAPGGLASFLEELSCSDSHR